jgi:uncharacterized protein YndB with AHSA1/START domain
MQFEMKVEIEATPEKVWATLTDVERWPEWTASMTTLERLNGDTLALGARVRIKQPGMPTLVWTVTQFDLGLSFSWRSTSPGVATVGTHLIEGAAGDRVTVTLSIHQSGMLAPVVGLFTSTKTRRYVNMEAQGLKQRCEAK